MSLWKAKKAITDAGFKVGSIRFSTAKTMTGKSFFARPRSGQRRRTWQ